MSWPLTLSVADVELDLQVSDTLEPQYLNSVPNENELKQWILTGLACTGNLTEIKQLTVRVVGETEISELNQTYRHKRGATNVLSFPVDLPTDIALPLLGDIVVCVAVLEKEAQLQQKPLQRHWAHIVIHGVLHLLGYDHNTDAEAAVMESLEVEILSKIGYPNPYIEMECHERHKQ